MSSSEPYQDDNVGDLSDDAGDVKVVLPQIEAEVEVEEQSRRASHSKRRWRTQHYVDLLNESIQNVNSPGTPSSGKDVDRRMRTSLQVGLTHWSDEERQSLSEELARCRRDDVVALKQALPDKAMVEILAFDDLLADSAYDHYLHGKRFLLPSQADIPAAAEIGAQCCRELERVADDIQTITWNEERRTEYGRYGDYWLLTPSVASNLERIEFHGHLSGELAESEGDEEDRKPQMVKPPAEVSAAVDLLHLPMFLQLANNVFNVPNEGESVPLLRDQPDQRSMFTTAFLDFRNLVVSITRRLVGASLFQANSRLRATNREPEPDLELAIKEQDVAAAVECLEMPPDSIRYWQDAPRRLGLQVYKTDRTSTGKRQYLSYDKLERILESDSELDDIDSEPQQGPSGTLPSRQVTSEESSTDQDSASDIEGEAMDTYLAALDGKSSAEIEEGLWKLLGHPYPADLSAKAAQELLPAPAVPRKHPDDLVDWRSRCNFKSEWERYGANAVGKSPPPNLSRKRSRQQMYRSRLRKRRRSIVSVTSADMDTESAASTVGSRFEDDHLLPALDMKDRFQHIVEGTSDPLPGTLPSASNSVRLPTPPPRGRTLRRSTTPGASSHGKFEHSTRRSRSDSDSDETYDPPG